MRTVTTIEIGRPAGEVFETIADMSRNPEWQKGMQSCVWTLDPPLKVGSTYDQVARFLGREIVSSFVVTELESCRRIRIESTKSTFPIDVTREVEATGDASCRVTATVTGEPRGILKLVSPMVSRSVRADYDRLKQLLEAG